MSAIVPEDEQDDFPAGFNTVGHVGTGFLLFPFGLASLD